MHMTNKFFLFRCLIALLASFSTAPLFAATLPANFAEQTIGGTWNEAAGLTFAAWLERVRIPASVRVQIDVDPYSFM